jgi:hypothetical protein
MNEFKESRLSDFLEEFNLSKEEVKNWPRAIQMEASKTAVLAFPRPSASPSVATEPAEE